MWEGKGTGERQQQPHTLPISGRLQSRHTKYKTRIAIIGTVAHNGIVNMLSKLKDTVKIMRVWNTKTTGT